MKILCVLAFACAAAFVSAAPASAVTIDFSGAGTADGDQVSTISSGGADIGFDTLDGFGKNVNVTDSFVRYRHTADYSGDQALYAATDGDVFELVMSLAPGLTFTNVTFGFGSTLAPISSVVGSPADTTTEYDLWGESFFDLIASNPTFSVNGTSGSSLTLIGLNKAALILQFGNHTDVGLQFISFETAGTATTPIPGPLLLLMTALTGLGGLAWRKRHA